MLSHQETLPAGTRVGPYELVRMLGAGGMGSVYEARASFGLVALKLVAFPSGGEPDRRFLREAEMLRALAHPGIVPVLDFGIDVRVGTPYLVMELLSGDDLAHTLARTGRLAPEVIVAIGVELVDALAHAHGRNIVHRDVKPANVFLPRDRARGRAVLCDFGLSKRTDLVMSLTETGALLGTPHYMSPEQFLDAKRVDGRSDVFSLAMTLLHALVGANPFDHLSDHGELMAALCSRPVPDARDLLAGAPDDLSRALAGALVTDPRARSDLATFRAALAACAVSADAQRERTTRRMAGAPEAKVADPAAPAPGPTPPALQLTDGTYRLRSRASDAAHVHEGLDGEGRSVRVERVLGVLQTAAGRAAFEAEVETLRAVLSESAVALLDHGALGADGWLVTEPKAGQDLRSLVDEAGPLPYARAVRAFSKAAKGLSALADAGLVHAHLRPEGFHFRPGPHGRKVLVLHDLGVAARLAPASSADPAAAKKKLDVRLDVLGLVSILCFAVTGKLPFAGRGGKPSARPEVLAKGGFGAAEKRAIEALVRRAVEGQIASLTALSVELRGLVGGTLTRA